MQVELLSKQHLAFVSLNPGPHLTNLGTRFLLTEVTGCGNNLTPKGTCQPCTAREPFPLFSKT